MLSSLAERLSAGTQPNETAVGRALLQLCGLGDTFLPGSLKFTESGGHNHKLHQQASTPVTLGDELSCLPKKNSNAPPLSSHAVCYTGKLGI